MRIFLLVFFFWLAACSSAPETKQAKQPAVEAPGGAATAIGKHPLAKYIEFAGFRISEAGPGMLKVKFIAVNHSEADLGDLAVKLRMTTAVAKPEDPPVAEFNAKIPSLGPQEIRDVTATTATKKRAYEIPDWQFIRAEFDIVSPAP